jgi:hypothetical protein
MVDKVKKKRKPPCDVIPIPVNASNNTYLVDAIVINILPILCKRASDEFFNPEDKYEYAALKQRKLRS